MIESSKYNTHIAYFSMEIALRGEIHTYAGGLGVLAGDTVRSCADLALPVVFVTLTSRAGYFRQEINLGRQVEHEDPWNPADWAEPLGVMVAVEIEGREVWIRPRLYVHHSPLGGSIPVLLLDTDLGENADEDRSITDHLYGGDEAYRLKQEIVLGVGGVRVLQALGFSISTYHLNEGHSALLTIELLRRFRRTRRPAAADGESAYDTARVRELCIFTTHTPVDAGHDRFPYDLVERIMGDLIEPNELKALAGNVCLNMTQLALELSGYVNGVARRHAETATRMYPGYDIKAITNGVHVSSWLHASFSRLYQAHFPQWSHEPECLIYADQLDDAAIWSAHQEAKADLLELTRKETGISLRPDRPVITFARRMTSYKRPTLLFDDIDRLLGIAQRTPFQVVIAGKAHPRDAAGKELIEKINHHIRSLANRIAIAFVPDYDLERAKLIVAGGDIWLNTPEPPMEASGTSGMKAALNGVLNLSVLDGWWVEACIEGVTGWSIGAGKDGNSWSADARSLYDRLEHVILPLYMSDRSSWTWMMKQSICKIGSRFNSQCMMRRYVAEAYIR